MQLWKVLLLTAALILGAVNFLIFGFLSRQSSLAYPEHFEAASAASSSEAGRQQLEQKLVQASNQTFTSNFAEHSSCRDSHTDCVFWAASGDCIKNAAWVLHHCQDSCGVCLYLTSPKRQIRRKVQLKNGQLMPTLGFGTAGLGDQTSAAVSAALEAGYRLFDSAQAREWYREDLVGEAIESSGVERADLFLTSKLHPRHLEQAAARFEDSLHDLKTSYLDLFLLHYPRCWDSLCPETSGSSWQSAWRELEGLVDAGKIRALGVSNFGLDDLSQLVSFARIKPSIVQSRSDPFSSDLLTQTFCARAGIQFQGYSTLGSQWLMQGYAESPVMTHPQIALMASSHDCSPAHIVLRWALQHGQAVIPRSANPERIASNLEVFEGFTLNLNEMRQLDALDGTLNFETVADVTKN